MARKSTLPSVAQVTATLRRKRRAASAACVEAGTRWYPENGALMERIAQEAFTATGDPITSGFVAGIVAAFSQNATWKANITMARNYCLGTGQNGMQRVMDEIHALEEDAYPPAIFSGLKRGDFWRNLTGDLSAVTCDRWHLRAAFGDRKVSLTPEVHALVTEATTRVAAEFDEAPATTQAIIWCHVRGTGA